jgi:iron complex outermembrane receptor protein
MAFDLKLSTLLAAIAASTTLTSLAQSPPRDLGAVTVTDKAGPELDVGSASVGGFAAPIAKLPQSVTVFAADVLAGSAAQSLSSVLKLDASLADNYNTTGYIESLSIRGLVLEQSSNFSRNGLASSNYAPIALENKERIEVLKGVAGLQSGVSAPGGLVNYVTKVPQKEDFTTLTVGADGNGGSKVHLDANKTVGALGLRLNLVDESLHSHFESANGSRQLLSLAVAAAIDADTTVSADFEVHRKSQPSVPGLGLLDSQGTGAGSSLPASINPRLNLNNQTWSQPFQANTTTAQLAVNRRFSADWQGQVAVSTQTSTINDRLAFPDGCSSAATYVYPGLCANGDVDIYDFRSEGEQRRLSSWDAHIDGKIKALGLSHDIRLGLAGRNARNDLPAMQAYNYAGTSNIYTPVTLDAAPALTVLNTNSRERTLEGYASLVSHLSANVQSFVGVRWSKISRSSELSSGEAAVALDQTVSTPWLGLAWSVNPATMLYASWGQGIEMEVVPLKSSFYDAAKVNLLRFQNYGQVLPAFKSEQTEVGVKWQVNSRLLLTAALFNINKPYADDVADAGGGLPLRVAGAKTAQHRGLELAAAGRVSEALSVQASVMALDATYTQALDATLVGQRVTNVPRTKGSVFADYKVSALPGLSLNALATYESAKSVTTDGSVALPAAWQLDAGMRYPLQIAGKLVTWRLNVENVTNRIYWREAPTTSWGGIYLFSSTPRTLRTTASIEF